MYLSVFYCVLDRHCIDFVYCFHMSHTRVTRVASLLTCFATSARLEIPGQPKALKAAQLAPPPPPPVPVATAAMTRVKDGERYGGFQGWFIWENAI